MKVQIIIVTHNRAEQLRKTIIKIAELKSKHEVDILVADNASADNTKEMVTILQKDYTNLRYMYSPENLGVGIHNVVLQKILEWTNKPKPDIFIFFDDDCYPKYNSFIDDVVGFYEEYQSHSLVSGIVRSEEGWPNSDVRFDELFKYPMTPTGFSAACFALPRKTVELLDGKIFDEKFFLFWNELDLYIRLKIMTISTSQNKKLEIVHNYQPNDGKSKMRPFLYTRNSFLLIWKYAKFWNRFKYTTRLLLQTFFATFSQRTLIYMRGFWEALKLYDGEYYPEGDRFLKNINSIFKTNIINYR
jgi:GT2 family glycosyltransferase